MVRPGFRLQNASLVTVCALMACGMVAAPGEAQKADPAAVAPPYVAPSPAAPSPVAAPLPVREQRSSLLEQIQDEVALVASQARLGIVTIEDPRAILYNYTVSPLRKVELQEQINHLEIDKKAAQEKLAQAQARFNAGSLTKFELDRNKHDLVRIEARLAALQRAHASTQQNDPLAERRQEIDAHIAELESDRKFYTEQANIIQQQVNAGVTATEDLIEAKRQMAHVAQDLYAAQTGNYAGMNAAFGIAGAPKSGSGFSIGDGYILTTADVVQGMSNPIVTTDDGRRARATLVAVDSELNIGLLRLPAALNVPALKLGDSARVVPGHFAISIGNQAGQMNSVSLSLISGTRTQGIASGRHFYPDLLQIDGAMGGGISGAPVLSARGEVIGMWAAALNNEAPVFVPSKNNILYPKLNIYYEMQADTKVQPSGKNPPLNVQPSEKYDLNQTDGQKTHDPAFSLRRAQSKPEKFVPPTLVLPRPLNLSAQYENLSMLGNQDNQPIFYGTPANSVASASSGFALPVNAFKGLIDRLKTGRNIVHVWLGMDLEDVDNAHEENGFVRLDQQVKVRGVYANSPAAKCGDIKNGDILVSLSDTPVHTANEVRSTVLLRFSSGQKINVSLRRSGKPVSVPLTLEARPTALPTMLSVPLPQNLVTVPSREPK